MEIMKMPQEIGRILFVIATMTLILPTRVHALEECSYDGECGGGKYCKFVDKGQSYCAECVDCRNRFKRFPGGKECPYSGYECGGCLPGFKEDELSRGGYSEKCRPLPPSPPSPPSQALTSSAWFIPVVIVSVLAVVTMAVVGAIHCAKKWRSRLPVPENSPPSRAPNHPVPVGRSQMPSPPPPYDNEAIRPLLPPTETNLSHQVPVPHSSEERFSCQIRAENEFKARAEPFCPPNYLGSSPQGNMDLGAGANNNNPTEVDLSPSAPNAEGNISFATEDGQQEEEEEDEQQREQNVRRLFGEGEPAQVPNPSNGSIEELWEVRPSPPQSLGHEVNQVEVERSPEDSNPDPPLDKPEEENTGSRVQNPALLQIQPPPTTTRDSGCPTSTPVSAHPSPPNVGERRRTRTVSVNASEVSQHLENSMVVAEAAGTSSEDEPEQPRPGSSRQESGNAQKRRHTQEEITLTLALYCKRTRETRAPPSDDEDDELGRNGRGLSK